MIKRQRPFTEIEEVARRLRAKLNIDHLERPDLISIFDNGLSNIYPGLRLIRVLDDKLVGSEARTDCYERTITTRESVYQGCLRGDPRARMTIAHELGHIALGHSGTRHRQNLTLGTRDERQEEREAWNFAEVFLAPTFLARDCSSAEEIGERFGISGDAADIRFAQLLPLIKEGSSPSQRWKSAEKRSEQESRDVDPSASSGNTAPSEPRRSRPLPSKVIDYLREAERLGRRITSLRKREDDD
jgi:Zn-dependent peptidase ImmA (M78 family)